MLPLIRLTRESGQQDLENLYSKRVDCPIPQPFRLLELLHLLPVGRAGTVCLTRTLC